MPASMQIVVAYDVADNRRRRRVSKCLEGYGVRVNYSVFECVIKPRLFKKLKKELEPLINEKEDSVRVYPLCRDCITKIEVMGIGDPGFEHFGLVYV